VEGIEGGVGLGVAWHGSLRRSCGIGMGIWVDIIAGAYDGFLGDWYFWYDHDVALVRRPLGMAQLQKSVCLPIDAFTASRCLMRRQRMKRTNVE
jgi:hypothetical protein